MRHLLLSPLALRFFYIFFADEGVENESHSRETEIKVQLKFSVNDFFCLAFKCASLRHCLAVGDDDRGKRRKQ